VSPILVRPVREQLEHDRIIRQLQAKFRRKFEAQINPGVEQNAPVQGAGPQPLYPDLVLTSLERSKKLLGIVEVETGESVNHLEALAEWSHFSKVRAPFHLYVPAGMVDVARRLCEDNQIYIAEIWSFHTVGDQVRFTMVHRTKEPPPVVRKPTPTSAAPAAPAKPQKEKETKKPAPVKNVKKAAASKKKPAAKKAAGKKKK